MAGSGNNRPLILAVDTTGPCQGIALARPGELVAVSAAAVTEKHSRNLLGNVRDLLFSQAVDWPVLDGLAVVTGPGSFTGIRIGLALTAGLAHGLGIPLAGRDTLELAARQPGLPDGVVIAAQDARRGRLYIAAYQRVGQALCVLSEPTEYGREELPELAVAWGGVWVADEDIFSILAERLPGRDLRPLREPRAATLALAAAAAPLPSPGPIPEAFYIRPPDAKIPAAILSMP